MQIWLTDFVLAPSFRPQLLKSGIPPYRRRRRSTADIDLHGLVERHVIPTTVVELRGAHGRMRGHDLRVFQSAAILQIGRDPGPAPGMVTNMGSRLWCRSKLAKV